jgi:hypothetical protein
VLAPNQYGRCIPGNTDLTKIFGAFKLISSPINVKKRRWTASQDMNSTILLLFYFV